MVTLTPNKPHRSATAEIVVENQLTPGRYLMRLVVVDDSRNESEPAELVVTVRERGVAPPPSRPFRPFNPDVVLRPDPVIRPIIPTPRRPGRPIR
jgi:hypothetical protein